MSRHRAESGDSEKAPDILYLDGNTESNYESEIESRRSGTEISYRDMTGAHGSARSTQNEYSARSGPISPEMFDTLAEQIVKRVKNELKIDKGERQSGNGHKIRDDDNECEELGDKLGESGYGLDSHRCHSCSQVMVGNIYTWTSVSINPVRAESATCVIDTLSP